MGRYRSEELLLEADVVDRQKLEQDYELLKRHRQPEWWEHPWDIDP
jgi:hypothetical protein